jgi:D-alanyl-lipoteichoic acid acyltransferase DltB (MBOAT superfamily)
MLFNSVDFLLFFPIVLLLYFITPHKYRWFLLLVASYYFYMCWKAEYIILIIISTIIDYTAAINIYIAATKAEKKGWLILSLLSNLGILISFKYLNFFNQNVQAVLDQFNIFYNIPVFDLLLPVGISFYTFQTMSYSIDVYKGDIEPEKHFGKFSLFVSFFPQLVAGPIERSSRLIPQFYEKFEFEHVRLRKGMILMFWGFFKKVVIADNVATYVDMVFNNVETADGLTSLLGSFFFTFQIYCDFSGYTDIAIGLAYILGFRLMDNFRRPYFSKSISEFWGRWHISLSSWFKDYVYIPLGGNRVGKSKHYFNLLLTFLVSGLWHGANWTFIVWGLIHGIILILESIFINVKGKRYTVFSMWLRWAITFSIVWIAWIFFRANSVSDALAVISNIFNPSKWSSVSLGIYVSDVYKYLGLITLLIFVELFDRKKRIVDRLSDSFGIVRWIFYVSLLLLILYFGAFNHNAFIYFQF